MVSVLTVLMIVHGTFAFAQNHEINAEVAVVNRATEAWMNGASPLALDILGQGLREHSHSLAFRKLRGDILTTIRRNQEALEDLSE